MTLEEIGHALLELLRQGHIVDDERFDIRLLYDFVVTKRAEYLKAVIDKRQGISENVKQSLDLPVESYNDGNSIILRTVEKVPSFLNTRNGLSITDITSDDETSYLFTYVPYNHFKYSGNGRFNQSIVFVTYKDGYLMVKSQNDVFKLIDNIKVSGVLQDPRNEPNFDNSTDEFPIDYDGFEYIKSTIINQDFRMFLSGVTDEASDSSGEIVK